eukprot:EG_transcript_15263
MMISGDALEEEYYRPPPPKAKKPALKRKAAAVSVEPTPPPPAETAQEPVKEGASRPAAKKLKRKRAAAEEGEQGTGQARSVATASSKPTGFTSTWGKQATTEPAELSAEAKERQRLKKEKQKARHRAYTQRKEETRTRPSHKLGDAGERAEWFWRCLGVGLARSGRPVPAEAPPALEDGLVMLPSEHHDLERLPRVLDHFFGDEAEECLRRGLKNGPGAPYVVCIASAAVRCLEIIRALRVFQSGEGHRLIPKLFSKHMDVEEQAKLLQRRPICIAVGTAGRLAALRDKGVLSLDQTRLLIVDMWRDPRALNIFEVHPTGEEFCRLYRETFHGRITAGHTKLLLF